MPPTLIAIAGPSRSGKGTCASIFTEGAQGLGLTVRERQLSGLGKQYVADAFRPGITEEEAIEWFEEMKAVPQDNDHGLIEVSIGALVQQPYSTAQWVSMHDETVPLQQYLQRMLQGARDRWGEDFWTDKLLPSGIGSEYPLKDRPLWWPYFQADEAYVADLCLISDLRQVNEAKRVKALGGYVVEMRRPPIEHAYVTGAGHITEQSLPPEFADYTIEGFADHNDETFAELKRRIGACWENFVKPMLEAT